MIERILGFGMLAGIIVRDILGYHTDTLIMVCGSLLALIYLFINWWINKPAMVNARSIVVTIFYGIASGSLTLALIFQLLYLTGSDEMSVLSFALLSMAVLADLLSGINRNKIINKWCAWRLGILTLSLLTLYLIPKDYRISITYRKFPDFISCYQANKGKADFDIIKRIYFYNYNAPGVTLTGCSK